MLFQTGEKLYGAQLKKQNNMLECSYHNVGKVLHLYEWWVVQVWGKWLRTLPSHLTFDEHQEFSWGTLTDNY